MKALWEFIASLLQVAWYLLLIGLGVGAVVGLAMLGAQKGGL